ncbi:hypothetical protein VFPPC_13504 [Pochonia chlamydosporia 170]|uniref:Uncharacterized protein n=1 Tax=Pochonia chlamydosporia 170 TaxID=1380566 RepID=A0A179G1W8_METCM|nr:hypothetical protein VFPPC_13504 [Pochonia chlamydosporia 170]OAQ71341.1 hypothetical protein VFPPC_13504 [Pochonia chlamydosporia 170]
MSSNDSTQFHAPESQPTKRRSSFSEKLHKLRMAVSPTHKAREDMDKLNLPPVKLEARYGPDGEPLQPKNMAANAQAIGYACAGAFTSPAVGGCIATDGCGWLLELSSDRRATSFSGHVPHEHTGGTLHHRLVKPRASPREKL